MRINLKNLLICTTILMATIPCTQAHAQGNEKNTNIEQKLETQNKEILDIIKKAPNTSDDKYNELLKQAEELQKDDREINLDDVKNNLTGGLTEISINTRKYSIPFYILILFSNIILASVLGSKSMSKRKHYLIGSILATIVFLVFINIPVISIYFRYNSTDGIINGLYEAMYSIIYALKRNSIVFFILLLVYGIVQKILGKNDSSKKINSNYLIKIAFGLLIILNIMPMVVEFIL